MPEILERVPPEWNALHKKSHRALIRAEVASLADMRDAASAAHAASIGRIATAKNHREALIVLRHTRPVLAAALAESIADARATARDAAQERLDDEMQKLERELAMLGLHMQPITVPRSDATEDTVVAQSLGDSYASAWTSAMLLVILKWERDGSKGNIAPKLAAVLAQLDFRVSRIAATETARAFNNEHDEGIGYVASTHKDARWLAAFFKRWDATLDRRTCGTCRRHDGELALVGRPFDDGDQPAEVHTLCRCLDSVVFLPARLRGAVNVEGHYTQDEDEEAA